MTQSTSHIEPQPPEVTVTDAFIEHLASITDEAERAALLASVKMRALDAAPAKAFAPVGRSFATLREEVPEEPDWLIPNVAAQGWMVKFAAREKTGKGTLIAHLLGRLERREPSVFGPAATKPVTALVYTEEPPESIREKAEFADLKQGWLIHGWELARYETWSAKVDYLVRAAQDGGHGVIFVDNISRAARAEDEAGVELARAGEVLSDAAKAAGLTVFIDHHHRKGAGKLEDKSRGGTGLSGACENNIEMVNPGSWTSRERRISSRGKMAATIWERTIALTEDGRDYIALEGATQGQTLKERGRLRKLDNLGEDGMTALEAAAAWDVAENTARKQLDEFGLKGWASPDGGRPERWRSTGEGLEGVTVDLLGEAE